MRNCAMPQKKTRQEANAALRAELDAVMEDVPKGALALSGIAVLLLLCGWFYVYFFIFVPRGAVG